MLGLNSYTRHVKWGSEAAAKGGREGAGWKVIRRVIHTPLLHYVSYEVMLELEHRDHTFTS